MLKSNYKNSISMEKCYSNLKKKIEEVHVSLPEVVNVFKHFVKNNLTKVNTLKTTRQHTKGYKSINEIQDSILSYEFITINIRFFFKMLLKKCLRHTFHTPFFSNNRY